VISGGVSLPDIIPFSFDVCQGKIRIHSSADPPTEPGRTEQPPEAEIQKAKNKLEKTDLFIYTAPELNGKEDPGAPRGTPTRRPER